MKKRVVVAAMAVLALAWARPSAADTIAFDYNGAAGGGQVSATEFDWKPGNSMLVEGAIVNGVQTGQIYYQANLNRILTTSGGVSDGTDGVYYTAVAAFDVAIAGSGFTVVPGTGVFNIYVHAEGGNDYTGQGFAADAGSTLILSGHAISGTGGLNLGTSVEQLDQFGSEVLAPEYGTGGQPAGDQYPNTETLRSTFGGFDVIIAVDSTNSAYFLSSPTTILVGMESSGDNKLPYNSVNPSQTFSSNGVADGDIPGATAVGPINGLCIGINPCRIVTQSDANTTLDVTTVPEPATLTLLGLGLAGSAAARRRQKKAQQQA